MDRWIDTKRGKDGEGRKVGRQGKKKARGGCHGGKNGGREGLFQDSSHIAYLIKPFQEKTLPVITPQ